MTIETKPQKKKATRRGKRGKGASAKNQEKQFQKYLRKVRFKRTGNRLTREHVGRTHVYPEIEVGRKADRQDYTEECSPQALEFYQDHAGGNRFLEVSDRANASNPEGTSGGGKGVFARVDIPKDTRVCFYTGVGQSTACDASVSCGYCLHVAPGFYLCAREELYEYGYLIGCLGADEARYHNGDAALLPGPCPPNYGRYVNTVSKLLKKRPPYNCAFELGDDGHDLMWITTCLAVAKGEELLIDYGSAFRSE